MLRKSEGDFLTLNDAESEQVAVLQSEEVTHLDQQLLTQGLHLQTRNEFINHLLVPFRKFISYIVKPAER